MIPIRDTIPSRHYPVVTHVLIAINVVVFLIEMSYGSNLNAFIYTYGLVPARFTGSDIARQLSPLQTLFTLISFMFVHGGFWHILGNMWFFYIFGDNIEDRLGSFHFLLFYIASGLVSGFCYVMINPGSTAPVIGASGAIAGVMGAYFILYPRARILTLIPIIIIPLFFEIPAFFFLGLWFALQLISASGRQADIAGIAWWAHIGGFIFGMAAMKVFHILPDSGTAESRPSAIRKRKSDHLQVLRPTGAADSVHLNEIIRITPYEAMAGTKKLINIPWGFHNRMYRVVIPPQTRDGAILRMKGMGRLMAGGERGDLFLKVEVEHPWQ